MGDFTASDGISIDVSKNTIYPTDYSKCESEELGRKLFAATLNNVELRDEIGGDGFGWCFLIVYQSVSYIAHISQTGTFLYKTYKNRSAAGKGWDHMCIKFEKWWTERNA